MLQVLAICRTGKELGLLPCHLHWPPARCMVEIPSRNDWFSAPPPEAFDQFRAFLLHRRLDLLCKRSEREIWTFILDRHASSLLSLNYLQCLHICTSKVFGSFSCIVIVTPSAENPSEESGMFLLSR